MKKLFFKLKSGCANDKLSFSFNRSAKNLHRKDGVFVMFDGYLSKKDLCGNDEIVGETVNDAQLAWMLYKQYGVDFAKKLDGSFAVIIYDQNNNKLLAARDQFGTIPLYYSINNGQVMVSTSLNEIVKRTKNNEIDKTALELFMNLRFIPAPYSIFKGTRKVESGTTVEIGNCDYKVHVNQKMCSPSTSKTKSDIAPALIKSVQKVVEDKERVGVFLSGGFDSSIIASVAKRKANTQLIAFSVGYEGDFECDETSSAKRIAEELGLEHRIIKLSKSNLAKICNKSIMYLEEPCYSTVSASSYYLSKHAAKEVDVALTGDGSDELFYGYKYLESALNSTDALSAYLNGLSWLKSAGVKDVMTNATISEDELKNILLSGVQMNDEAETLRRVEVFKRLSEYHLLRVGKLARASNLQIRNAFLNSGVVAVALGLTHDELANLEDPKMVLKKCMEEYLTQEMRDAIKKPFTTPVKNWIETILCKDIRRLFNRGDLSVLLGLRHEQVLKLYNDYDGSYADVSTIWGLYLLLKWAEKYKKYLNRGK